MSQAGAVSVGQRYIKSYKFTRDRTEWEVLGVTVVGTVSHAQLVNCRDPFDLRTVSCAELAGGGVFRLAKDSQEDLRAPVPHIAGETSRFVESSARAGRILRQITEAARRYRRATHLPFRRAKAASTTMDKQHETG